MTPEVLLGLVAELGMNGVLLWLVWDMRKEAREDRQIMWQLLRDELRSNNPAANVPTLPSASK